MDGSREQSLSRLKALPGKAVIRIARILYEYQGTAEIDDGPLELALDDGTVVLIDGEADGESLRVREGSWVDPFQHPSEENQAFIEEHGKWKRFECSEWDGYREIVGHRVSSVTILENEFGRVAGARIVAENKSLWVFVQWDECNVQWDKPEGIREITGLQ